MLTQSLQTLGGSGFLQDYPIEQYIRDAKIDTLYEGTTAIQGLDFFFRKMVRDQFKAVFHLASQVTETVKGGGDGDQLDRPAASARAGAGGRAGRHRQARRVGHGVAAVRHQRVVPGRAEHHPAAHDVRRPGHRLAAAAPGRGGPGRAGRWRIGQGRGVLHRQGRTRRSGSPRTACRCWPPSASWPSRPTWGSWSCPKRPSDATVKGPDLRRSGPFTLPSECAE